MFLVALFASLSLCFNVHGLNIIAFYKTNGFTHSSIDDALDMIDMIAQNYSWNVTRSDESEIFNNVNFLSTIDVVIFCLTSGDDILDSTGKSNFENWWTTHPGGFVGLHSATDTEYDWDFYGNMLGAYFSDHPDQQTATLTYKNPVREDKNNTVTWTYYEEWYNFDKNVADYDESEGFLILGTVDESTYSDGTMGDPHPIVWAHHYEGGRVWYSAQGHNDDFYDKDETDFYLVAENAIKWAGNLISDVDLLETILGKVEDDGGNSGDSGDSGDGSGDDDDSSRANLMSVGIVFWLVLIIKCLIF